MDPSRAYSGVNSFYQIVKLQQISDISPTIAFTEFDILQKYRESFRISELGRIRSLLPIKELAKVINSHFRRKHP